MSSEEEEGEETEERYRSARSLRARAIAEDVLDDILDRGPKLPEPLAALLLEVEVARDENDNTGVRKRLYELAVGVVRYAFSVGLAALRASLPNASAPGPIADAIRKSFKLTDGRWLELVRLLEGALRRSSPSIAKALKFASSPVLNAMVQSRNAFIHAGATGDDAGERARETLDAAADLIALPLRVAIAGPQFELRQGVPKRKGVWRKTAEIDPEMAAQLTAGQAYLLLDAHTALPIDPWLPHTEGTLRLVDSPHAPGRRWRCICPETGEHLENAAFDSALRAFVGEDGSAPRPPVDRPQIVGREGQMSLVARALKEAAAGRIRVVLVSGPQGSGLTRKLAETIAGGVGFGFQIAIEAFASSDRRTPFAALRLALSAAPADSALSGLRDAFESLVSSGRVSDRSRFDVEIECLEERIVALSRKFPILITIDDAQWLDEQTLALLRLLVDRASRGALGSLAVVIAAHDESSPAPGLAQLMIDIDKEVGSGATRVVLPPLDETTSRRLVQRVAPFDQDVETTVVSGASGLPFYLVQPLLVWVETGALEWKNGVWARAGSSDHLGGVPGLAELALGRIASYFEQGSDAEQAAHYVLALVSGDSSPTPMQRVFSVLEKLEGDSSLVTRVIETLLGAGILVRREPQAVAIPQPIVARALATKYHERAWWIRFARIVLGVLEEEPPHLRDAETIARGFDSLGDQERALPWYRDAIAQRLRQGAFEQARILAEHLAPRETTDKLRLAAELAAIEAMARNGAAAAALTRHQQMLVPANRRLELEWRIAGEVIAAGAGRPTEQDLERLVADSDKIGNLTQQVNARLVLARRKRGRVGRDAIQEALERLDDDAAETDAPLESDIRYRLLALDLELAYETREGGVDALRQAAARAKAAARQIGSTWAELDVANDAAILEADAGDLDQAVAQLVDVAVRAGQAHFGSVRRVALTNAAALLLRASRGGDALAYSMTAETESRAAGDARSLALALSLRSESELLRNEVKMALDAISESIAIRERSGDKSTIAVALLRRADAKEKLSDLAGARQDGLLALERAEAASNVDHGALAKLWIALFDVRQDPSAKALNALADVLGSLVAITPKLRAPTLKKRDEAIQILRSRGIDIHHG